MAARGGTRTLKLLVFWCDCCWSARNNQECKQHKTIVRKPRHVPRRRSWTCWYWQQRKGHRCKSARPSPVSHGVPIRGAGLPHDGRMLQDDRGDSGVCRTETRQRERPARLPLKLMPLLDPFGVRQLLDGATPLPLVLLSDLRAPRELGSRLIDVAWVVTIFF